jgi:hypothetical protein
MLYNKALIMWRSKTQETTALSTTEAEYYSHLRPGLRFCISELFWNDLASLIEDTHTSV